jgi:hypothetical protein
MRISRTTADLLYLAQIPVLSVISTKVREALWAWEPWFRYGWHRFPSYLMSTMIVTIVLFVPLFLLRRRYLQVEDRTNE